MAEGLNKAEDDYNYEHVTMDVLRQDFTFETGPRPGESMPEFEVVTTERKRLNTTQWIGKKPWLLIFGSVSCPMTATSMVPLTRLFNRYGDAITFVTLNVREAHPGEGIRQPGCFEEKFQHAVDLKKRYHIPWTVASDDLKGSLHRALDSKPNAAYLIDKQGNIAFRALWAADERGLEQALDSIVSGREPRERQSERKLVPMTMGVGEMKSVLEDAGPQAKKDIWRAAAPMASMAWVASWFPPLSPLARGVVAMGLMTGVIVGLLIGLVTWIA